MEQPAVPACTSQQSPRQPLRCHNQNALPRRPRPSDAPLAKKARNDAHRAKLKQNRASMSPEELASTKQDGKVTFTAPNLAEKNQLMTMLRTIKANIGPSRSSQEGNFAVLKEVFNFYIQHHSPSTFRQMAEGGASPSFPSMEMQKEDSTQQIVLLTPKKLNDLLALAEVHLRTCRGSVHMEEDFAMDGHVGICTFLCTACPWSARWNTSPKLPNNRFLVNDRMLHGSFTSGILPTQYEKFCSAAGIGVVKDQDKNVGT
uniref:Uncharacterized protein n=1 Tax=Branchiostoma floridae TaxID=7739 RepID=C3ZGF4_BRAFL|eukprot:XP_002592387.1 hypothetical protein BRAFLDRAFT_67252 [Branchiostoma floridae]